ncbi:MAG TPA: N(2)-acetyl-L-2,4-diaminobutanoate deacetylase DoeB, partial [Kiloniellaceae bacterium]|nr:N(2)-acetyl-L-2,4-diaminobutanoate deacetylase DoeB [Kiloniellaceae bacterium]
SATVDFNAEGVQHGHLRLPYSHDSSAWGSIMIPITVVKNGDGPTALLSGANHGDEYEGPIALFDLAAKLRPDEITGRVIVVPAMNYPAFQAGTRTSSIDKGNMNRVFPGRPDGTVTEKIADYFQRTLLPLADYVLDIHSGGKTLDFIPFAAAHILEDKDQQARCVAAMEAFGAPYSVMLLEIDSIGMYDSAAEEMGKVFLSTELGGGGSASARTAAIARRGVTNFLVHAGILDGPLEAASSVRLDMPDGRCFVTSEGSGLIEYCVELGDKVKAGQVIARVYNTEISGKAPLDYRAQVAGIFAGRHFPGLIKPGDFLGMVAVPVD